MIEPVVDGDGKLQWVSIVPPISGVELDVLIAAVKRWKNAPVVYTHGMPEVKIIPLINGRFEPDIEDTP